MKGDYEQAKDGLYLQTKEIKHNLTQEQLNVLLGARVETPKEFLLIPPDIRISELDTSVGVFGRLDMTRDGERLISWKSKTEDAYAIMPFSKFMQLAELIPTILEILVGRSTKAMEVSEAIREEGQGEN